MTPHADNSLISRMQARALPIVALILGGVVVGAGVAQAAQGTGRQDVVTVQCRLQNSVPRNGGHRPEPPFSWHFRVDFRRETVDGRLGIFTPTRIQWEGAQMPARPYATLSLPDWHFHSARQIGRVWNEVTGICTEQ